MSVKIARWLEYTLSMLPKMHLRMLAVARFCVGGCHLERLTFSGYEEIREPQFNVRNYWKAMESGLSCLCLYAFSRMEQ